VPEMTQTTTAAPAENLGRIVLGRSRRSAFNQRTALVWDALVLTCLYSWGNQTSGSPLENPMQIAFRGEGAPGSLALSIEKLLDANQKYFAQLETVEPEQASSIDVIDIPRELRSFVQRLGELPTVEALMAQETDQGFRTWVVVNNASEQTRYAVYRAEWELMQRFPDIPFDLHLIDREGEELDSIITFDDDTLLIAIGEALRAL
jgi:hypothetical protein